MYIYIIYRGKYTFGVAPSQEMKVYKDPVY